MSCVSVCLLMYRIMMKPDERNFGVVSRVVCVAKFTFY